MIFGNVVKFPSLKIDTARASPSGKASAFQADIHGFESRRPLCVLNRARSSVAERTAHNRLVVGSKPTGPTALNGRPKVVCFAYPTRRRQV